jgi:hypothetical protein
MLDSSGFQNITEPGMQCRIESCFGVAAVAKTPTLY